MADADTPDRAPGNDEPLDLNARFPEMRPMGSVPTLQTVNGIGLGIYGRRDFDDETHTYVKTHGLVLLFIPFFNLGAYRVADAPGGGWYFLGREPLSSLAKGWNAVVAALFLLGGGWLGWHLYTGTDDYKAGQVIARADAEAAAGGLPGAAAGYRDVALGTTSHAGEAAAKLSALLDGPVAQAEPAAAAAVLEAAAEVALAKPQALPNVFDRGKSLAEARADADPRGAVKMLDAVAPFAEPPDVLTAPRRALLEKANAKHPDDVEVAGFLAAELLEAKELDRCEKLLTPVRDKLGSTEGARVLGQLLARKDKLDEALALLQPYVDARLAQLHAAEQRLEAAERSTREAAIKDLKDNNGPMARELAEAGEARQREIVINHIINKMKANPAIGRAQREMGRLTSVVPVTLELGVARLRRGQAQVDPAARKAEMEKAEKTFLSVRGVAGESDPYRRYLGQVYYWLGKAAEGKKLFDELLKSRNRSPEALTGVAQALREVGAVTEARALVEEAHRTANDQHVKEDIAAFRAVMATDNDDKLTWLRRADTSQPEVKAQLATAEGNQAALVGREEEAAGHLRRAVELYEQMPPSDTALNNGALAGYSLYAVTGDPQVLDRCLRMLEKALALNPTDSIVLSNLANAQFEAAVRDFVGPRVDFRTLRARGNTGVLTYLARDQAGRRQLQEGLRAHAGVARARDSFERLVVISPKSVSAYADLDTLYATTGDTAGLKKTLERVAAAEFNLSESLKDQLDFYKGTKDSQQKEQAAAAQKRATERLAAARKVGGVTFAVAAGDLLSAQTTAELYGVPVDADAVVAAAEEAHAASPSGGSAAVLQGALMVRGGRRVAAEVPAYAALVKVAGRSMGGHIGLLPVALGRPGPARDALRADADIRRATTMLAAEQPAFPDDPTPYAWAVLRVTNPEAAKAVADRLKADEKGRLDEAIDQKLSPASAPLAYRALWRAQATGGPVDEARAALKKCRDAGVPLPPGAE
jgi:tetratricopeptide (TPR) repeat protein